MSIPQVPERVRRAPTQALRAVFAGIGRLLMSADRPEAIVAAPESGAGTAAYETEAGERDVSHRQRPAQRQQRAADMPPAEAGARWRSLDQTGNVRLLSASDQVADDPPAAPVVEFPSHVGTEHSLPLANYDSLSLASIRARLRGLDVGQLKILLDYEAVNAERPEVLGMFERRIAKLESAG